MNGNVSLVDWAPTARLALLALTLALLPLSWWWLRQRGADTRARLAALTALTLFLTFDLIVFGAFTRLTDSGLGCPDWPGCYGQASPLGATAQIDAAQSALPSGPVTFSKAWIEMIHRYLAMTVGVLILVMAVVAWTKRQQLPFSPWWPTFTLLWVVVQGLFGKYTVTLKLYPAVVTLHLLGGLFLLALLAFQHSAFRQTRLVASPVLSPALFRGAWLAAVVLTCQLALGGWVSTNYAVLACNGFPQCNGQWWPAMDAARGFTFLRGLGGSGATGPINAEALVAIHMAHRLFAVVAALALGLLAWRLLKTQGTQLLGRWLAVLLAGQLLTGLSNVVLGWPKAAALAHSAGAAALVLVLALLLSRASAWRAALHGHAALPTAGRRTATAA
jgi:heme a synthase